KQVAGYQTKLGLSGSQAQAVEQVLVHSYDKMTYLREQVRNGDLDWDEARGKMREQRRALDKELIDKLGPELGEQLNQLRDEERDEWRGRGRGGNRDRGSDDSQ